MAINYRILDLMRRGRSEHENHLIDGLVAGRVSRREFMRYGSVLGLSACRSWAASRQPSVFGAAPRLARAATPGGTIRVAQIVPAAAIDPVKIADGGGITVLSQVAETLVLSGGDLTAGRCWPRAGRRTRTARSGPSSCARASNSTTARPMTADDVVASFDRLADPANGSNALSAFTGMLSKGGTRKVDDYTVEFHLDAANGNFPYAVSTDNYNAVILPADYAGDFEQTMIGTGPFKLEKYTPKVGASFVRNPDYWGGQAAARPGRAQLLRRLPAADPGAAGRPDRHHPADAGAAGRRPAERSRISTSSARRRRRTSRCICAPTWIRSRTSACAARSRSASTGRSSCRA